jgi:hypothetical protein
VKAKSMQELEQENYILRSIIKDTLWMARRYADGRSTYAPSAVNMAIEKAKQLGITIGTDTSLDGLDGEPRLYCKDGMFGCWDPDSQRFKS